MGFDPVRFRKLVRYLCADGEGNPALGASDARAVVAIATLAAEIDLDEVRDEVALLAPLADELCAAAGISPATLEPVSPLPLNKAERAARIREFAALLTDARGRELAYVAAYLVAVADLELGPGESAFLDELRRVLELDDARTAELAGTAAQFLTPGATPAIYARMER